LQLTSKHTYIRLLPLSTSPPNHVKIGNGAAVLRSHSRHCLCVHHRQTSVEKLHLSTRLALASDIAAARNLPSLGMASSHSHGYETSVASPSRLSPVHWSLPATPGEHWNGWRRGSITALAGRVPPKTPRGAHGRTCSRRGLAPPQVAVGPLAPRVQAAQDRPACPLPHGAGSQPRPALRACSPPARRASTWFSGAALATFGKFRLKSSRAAGARR
jgi:hypothetical protein